VGIDAATSNRPEHPHVSITRVVRGRFVEFQFSLGDEDLVVELIMPPDPFAEFCRERGLPVHAAGDGVREAYGFLRRRHICLPELSETPDPVTAEDTRGSAA